METTKNNIPLSLEDAEGEIDYTLTNDYMFRAILQSNEKVLRGLISSLLHLKPEEIDTVKIENPIVLGKAIDNKNFVLDLRVTLNNRASLNLEMQVCNHGNWADRSLSYLCRSFDSLNKGELYENSRPAIHIGILDFILFPDDPEFYATNKMCNIRSHKVFSDKFTLNVLSLKQIELATEEDKQWQIDTWARLFAAKTWKELKMIAKNNDILTSATQTLYEYNSEEMIREQCRAREDFERHERTVQKRLADQEARLQEQAAKLEVYEKLLTENNIPH